MLVRFIFITLLLFFYTKLISQESPEAEKENPILFTEFVMGYAGGSVNGSTLGALVNYQSDKKLQRQ